MSPSPSKKQAVGTFGRALFGPYEARVLHTVRCAPGYKPGPGRGSQLGEDHWRLLSYQPTAGAVRWTTFCFAGEDDAGRTSGRRILFVGGNTRFKRPPGPDGMLEPQ